MTSTTINPAPERAEHTGITAPLSAEAANALAKPERAFLPLHVVRAVRRFEAASARRDELAAKPASQWTPAEFDSFKAAHGAVVESVLALGAAGRLDLIAPAVTATRYRDASARCASASDAGNINGCLAAQDEMRMCRCQLESAGRLDLIEDAA